MMAKTHMLLAVTVTSMVLETTHPIVLGTAALASQLPDVDTSTSFAGRWCWPLARWLESRFAHRTVTHSFLATVFIALLAWPLRSHSAQLWAAFILGYFSGWFGDTFTKAGVAAFYPLSSARLVIPANPRLRLTTGTRAEYVVLALLLIALLGSLHLNSNGGLLRGVNVWLAQPEGVAALFARESTRHQILAHITGRLVASAQLTQEEFEVLEVEGERLLVRNRQGQRFWAGHTQTCPTCHLDIHRVQARIGHVIAIATHELRWQDEELSKVIGGRWSVIGKTASPSPQNNHPSLAPGSSLPATGHRPPTTNFAPPSTVLFSGELTLHDAEDLHVPMSFQQFNPLEIVGQANEGARVRTVRVRAATWADLMPLQTYFGSGHLVVKLIRRKGDFANEPAE
jgi:inner membrane protein